jgi:hypothetical protein
MMLARVNLQLIKTTAFDSGAIGMLAMVLHQFSSPGRYRAAISSRGRGHRYITFDVDSKSEVMQLDIDLAAAITLKGKEGISGASRGKREEQAGTLSPKGYVLFHASSGSGYSVIVADSLGRVVFNSAKLGNGDLFAVSLLEPGGYSMKNSIDSSGGDISVTLPEKMFGKLREVETKYVDVSEKKLDPQRIDLISSQGLVFRIKSPARIVIAKEADVQKAGKIKSKPMIRWHKLES